MRWKWSGLHQPEVFLAHRNARLTLHGRQLLPGVAAEEASPDLGARAADRLWSVGGDLQPADVLIHSWKLASSVNRLGQSCNPSSVMSIPVSRGTTSTRMIAFIGGLRRFPGQARWAPQPRAARSCPDDFVVVLYASRFHIVGGERLPVVPPHRQTVLFGQRDSRQRLLTFPIAGKYPFTGVDFHTKTSLAYRR